MTNVSAAWRDGIQRFMEVSIPLHPGARGEGLSEQDAIWPCRLRRVLRSSLTFWGFPALIDSAELLLTELVTNALCHGRGSAIEVGVFFRGGRLVIEVEDGCPTRPQLRHAGQWEEGGRGLFLVESVADAWGVSADGTTTWCTLPLSEGTSTEYPAAGSAPVLGQAPLDLPADSNAACLARVQARAVRLAWQPRGSGGGVWWCASTGVSALRAARAVREAVPSSQGLDARLLAWSWGSARRAPAGVCAWGWPGGSTP